MASRERQQDRKEHAEQRSAAQQAYESRDPVLTWELKRFLDAQAAFTQYAGQALNELLQLRGDVAALRQRHPDAIPALVELIAGAFKLSAASISAALGLPTQHDALDTLLLDTLHTLSPEGKNGVLPLSRLVAEVNAGCGPHDGLSSRLIASRLRALSCVFTDHHPPSVIVIPRLVPALVLSGESPNARENGSTTQTSP